MCSKPIHPLPHLTTVPPKIRLHNNKHFHLNKSTPKDIIYLKQIKKDAMTTQETKTKLTNPKNIKNKKTKPREYLY